MTVVFLGKKAMVDLTEVDSSGLAKTTTQQLLAELWRRGYCAMPSALAEDLLLAAGQGEGRQSDCLTGALAAYIEAAGIQRH